MAEAQNNSSDDQKTQKALMGADEGALYPADPSRLLEMQNNNNEQLIKEIEQRKLALEKLQQDTIDLNEIITTQSLLTKAEFDQNAFMNFVAERIRLMTPACGAVVELVDGDEMVYRAVSGIIGSYLGMRLKMTGSLSGLCVTKQEVLRCDDTENDPRVNVEACRKIGVRSMVVAPLFHAGNAVGVLKIVAKEPRIFAEHDVQTLQLMAGLIGAAIGQQINLEMNQQLLTERTHALASLQEEMESRKYIESILRLNEQRTRMILESSYDAFIGMDAAGKITDWNRQAELTFGFPNQEAVGKHLAELIIPERFRKAHQEGMARFLATGEGQVLNKRIQLPALRRSGEEFPVEVTITPVKNGNKYEFYAFLHDITERQKIETSKNELVSIVSHELRTPLTSIRGSLGLLVSGAMGGFDDTTMKMLSIAHTNCERLIRLINNILDVEKIESGTIELQLTQVDLNTLVQEVIAANQAYGEKFDVKIALTQTSGSFFIECDQDRLSQVLTNLISNAVKFSPVGKQVDVSIKPHADQVRVSVTDYGSGIPEEFKSRIFQKFAQAEPVGTRRKSGTGLGLSISKAIIEKLQGTINFTTKANEGTTFYFDLPIRQEKTLLSSTPPSSEKTQ